MQYFTRMHTIKQVHRLGIWLVRPNIDDAPYRIRVVDNFGNLVEADYAAVAASVQN